MTVTNPPFSLQNEAHSAQLHREAIASLLGQTGGVVAASDFALTQNGTPNMSVNVGAGRAWIPGTSLATVNPGGGAFYPQGMYFVESDAVVNVPIGAADITNPRIDTIILRIQDKAYVGSTDLADPEVVPGTPTPGANLSNLNGKGTVPVSSLPLGYAQVPANATSIVTANILMTVPALSAALSPLTPFAGGVSGTILPGQFVEANGGTTQTLPAAPIKNTLVAVAANATASGTNPVTVAAGASGAIYGPGLSAVASFKLGTPWASVWLMGDGVNWIISGQPDTGWVPFVANAGGPYQIFTPGGVTNYARVVGGNALLRGQFQAGSTLAGGGGNLTDGLLPPIAYPAASLPVGPYLMLSSTGTIGLANGVQSGTVLALNGLSYPIN